MKFVWSIMINLDLLLIFLLCFGVLRLACCKCCNIQPKWLYKKDYGPQNLIQKRVRSPIFVESNYFERNYTYNCASKKLQG